MKLWCACRRTVPHSSEVLSASQCARRPAGGKTVCLHRNNSASPINLRSLMRLAILELSHTGVNESSRCLALVRQCGASADLFGLWLSLRDVCFGLEMCDNIEPREHLADISPVWLYQAAVVLQEVILIHIHCMCPLKKKGGEREGDIVSQPLGRPCTHCMCLLSLRVFSLATIAETNITKSSLRAVNGKLWVGHGNPALIYISMQTN